MRPADFANLAQALDYAAQGETGCGFYNRRGKRYAVLLYSELQQQARSLAMQLAALQQPRGSRVAIIAETGPDFLITFFACQYAGLIPVPLPVPTSIGSHKSFAGLLGRLIRESDTSIIVTPEGYLALVREASEGLSLAYVGTGESLQDRNPGVVSKLQPLESHELAYLQYTSGSTRSPRGVMISQQAVLDNVAAIITHGVIMRPGDRCVSWLPFYHDMGLVGLILVPVCSQVSVDYLGTSDFAMRPRQWLSLMSSSRATISFSPPFGYELVARRLRSNEIEQYDLSAWRVAGVGAEMIHADTLHKFSKTLLPAKFNPRAFVPTYGMAECSLAISFVALQQQLAVDYVDADRVAGEGKAWPCAKDNASCRVRGFVNCGRLLPGFKMQIRDDQGHLLGDREIGNIFLRGPSIMSGYYGLPGLTRATLSAEGWLDTGDKGYQVADQLFLTGRSKDVIIINGKNIWPQDIEYLMEKEPEVRSGDSVAFVIPDEQGKDLTVVLVQCRLSESEPRKALVSRLNNKVLREIGLECQIELIPLHTLPRTTSGKLSRAKSRENYLRQSPASID